MPSLLSPASQVLLCSMVVELVPNTCTTLHCSLIVIFGSSVSRDALSASIETNLNDIQISLRTTFAEVIKQLR